MRNRLMNINTAFTRALQWIVIACLTALAGCIQTAPIPGYARVGDQVVIGLGGIQHNASSNYFLSPSDINATLTDYSGHVFNLTPISTFKAFPDYLSTMTYGTANGTGPTPVKPFDGGWFVTLTVADANNTGVPIALGQANIAITSPKLTQTNAYGEGTYASQKIEIIAGPTSQNTFGTQFTYYQGNNYNLVITPTNTTQLSSATTVGGLMLQITYTDESKLGNNAIILPFAHHPYLQVLQKTKSNGDGTGSIIAFITNPYGFVPCASRALNQDCLEDLNVGLQWFTSSSTTDIRPTVTVTGSYIDLNGNPIGGVNPQFN